MKMNNKNNNQKIKIINLGKKNNKDVENGKKQTANNNQKKVIESYYIKNNGIQYIKKKLNFENYTTFDKKNNISLFSFLSSQTNHDDKITNNSLKTTKESNYNQINLMFLKECFLLYQGPPRGPRFSHRSALFFQEEMSYCGISHRYF